MSNATVKSQSHVVHTEKVEPLTVLNAQGEIVNEAWMPDLSDDQLKELMRRMVLTRRSTNGQSACNAKARLGFYAPVSGQEATMIGSQYALKKDDFICPGYRDIPQIFWHGLPLYQAFLYSRGHQHGGQIPEDVNVLMPQIIIGAQIVAGGRRGDGLEEKRQEKCRDYLHRRRRFFPGRFLRRYELCRRVQVAGHFLVQNNGYAISTPRKQTDGGRDHRPESGSGRHSRVQVDGMDVLAVYQSGARCGGARPPR